MTLLERKIDEFFSAIGPGIYRIGLITDAVNVTMRYPRWSPRDVAECLKRCPRAKYVGRFHDHSAGSSMWQVIA